MIKWNLWTGVPRVKLWEAVALVLEIPPRSLEPTPHGWMNAGPGREAAPSFLPRSFPSNEKCRAFDEALEFAERGASFDGPIYILSTPFTGMSMRKAEVSLPEVVAFFVSCEWPDIPAPLLALVSAAASKPADDAAEPVVLAPTAAEPVPVTDEAPPVSGALPDNQMQRRRTCLDWFRAEGGKRPSENGKPGKRGALQRVVEKSGIDKDTLGAMLDKAIDEKRSADAFAQLTAKR